MNVRQVLKASVSALNGGYCGDRGAMPKWAARGQIVDMELTRKSVVLASDLKA